MKTKRATAGRAEGSAIRRAAGKRAGAEDPTGRRSSAEGATGRRSSAKGATGKRSIAKSATGKLPIAKGSAGDHSAPPVSLSVQYAVDAPTLPRWRLRRWIQRALAAARDDGWVDFHGAEISLRIVGLAEGRQLNHAFRGRDYATNVLTFEYGIGPDGVARGDIVLCLPVLRREAREQAKAPLAHAAHLTIHGALHALGYDHIEAAEAKRMEGLETRVLADMAIADPYAPR